MSTTIAPLRLVIYGVNDVIKKELTRAIVPWGILEMAIDMQADFENLETDKDGVPTGVSKEQIEKLTEFVLLVFDYEVTAKELKRGAGIADMFALYRQIFTMVAQAQGVNPMTTLVRQKQELQRVRQSRKK